VYNPAHDQLQNLANALAAAPGGLGLVVYSVHLGCVRVASLRSEGGSVGGEGEEGEVSVSVGVCEELSCVCACAVWHAAVACVYAQRWLASMRSGGFRLCAAVVCVYAQRWLSSMRSGGFRLCAAVAFVYASLMLPARRAGGSCVAYVCRLVAYACRLIAPFRLPPLLASKPLLQPYSPPRPYHSPSPPPHSPSPPPC